MGKEGGVGVCRMAAGIRELARILQRGPVVSGGDATSTRLAWPAHLLENNNAPPLRLCCRLVQLIHLRGPRLCMFVPTGPAATTRAHTHAHLHSHPQTHLHPHPHPRAPTPTAPISSRGLKWGYATQKRASLSCTCDYVAWVAASTWEGSEPVLPAACAAATPQDLKGTWKGRRGTRTLPRPRHQGPPPSTLGSRTQGTLQRSG